MRARLFLGLAICWAGFVWLTPQSHAIVLDLTGSGVTNGSINGALFERWNYRSTGTGNFASFLRIQGNGAERGYNTNGATEFQTMPGQWTRALLLGDVPLVNINGVSYREFRLDINQSSSHSLLSLDCLMVYLSSSSTLSGYPGNFGTAIYSLDANANSTVLLDASLSSGSGQGDVAMFLPDNLFTGSSSQYVYFYNMFGATQGYEANGGFEEWGVGVSGNEEPIIPEPATLVLCGLGLGLAGLLKRNRKR